MHQGRQQHDQLQAEIDSLKARRSNIPAEQIRMREMLCQALDLPEAEMPFAGELLQVREDERDWEGAAERLLRNFGLSLLVPDAHYPRVAEWVDRTHLRGRLVYFRVRDREPRRTAVAAPGLPGAQAHDQARFGLLRLAGTGAGAPFRCRLLPDQ